MEDSTTNAESLSNEISTPDTSGKVDEVIIGNDEIPTNTDDENTLIDQINNSDNTLTPTQILAQKMINHEPLTEYKESDTPNVEESNIEPVTNTQITSSDIFVDPVRNLEFKLKSIMDYDKKRYWKMISNKDKLPFNELEWKYRIYWMDETFYSENKETLLHAYMRYSNDVPKDVWFRYLNIVSPYEGKSLFDVAMENNTVPNYPFYEYLTGEDNEGEELLLAICPEALDMSLKDLILAIRNYKSSIIPAKVSDMNLDNKFVKLEESEKDE